MPFLRLFRRALSQDLPHFVLGTAMALAAHVAHALPLPPQELTHSIQDYRVVELSAAEISAGNYEAAIRVALARGEIDVGLTSDELALDYQKRVSGTAATRPLTYLRFRQTHHGFSVRGSTINFTVTDAGRIVSTVARVFPGLTLTSLAGPFDSGEILSRAAGALGINAADSVIHRERNIQWFARDESDGRFALVEEVVFVSASDMALVDLVTGEVALRSRAIELESPQSAAPEITASPDVLVGEVWGRGVLFDPRATGNHLFSLPLSDLLVSLPDGSGGYSGPDGRFSITPEFDSPPYLLSTSLQDGRWSSVSNALGPTLQVSSLASFTRPSQLIVNASGNREFDTAQVNAYAYTTFTHNWLRARGVDPAGIDIPLPTEVNLTGMCNAYYFMTPPSIRFFIATPLCLNSAYDTIIVHEYGHFVDDMIGGISELGLSEGWGDVLATYLTGQPLIGENYSGHGRHIRTADNSYRSPPYGEGEVHDRGQAWAGFAWHAREALRRSLGGAQGQAIAEDLFVPVLWANSPSIVAAATEVFLRDDDDENLFNGTPHYDELAPAAARHALSNALPFAPRVQIQYPLYGRPGDYVVLFGDNFISPVEGTYGLSFGGLPTLALHWTNDFVVARIPDGMTSGYSELTAGSLKTRQIYFNVLQTEISHMHRVAGTVNAGDSHGEGTSALSEEVAFQSPRGLVGDRSGNLYFVDKNYIRRIDVWGTLDRLATLPPGSMLSALAIDDQGTLYAADLNSSKIFRYVPETAQLTAFAGTGVHGYNGDNQAALTAELNRPSGLSFDPQGNLYIADTGNHRIRRVDLQGVITTVAGSGVASYCGDGSAATQGCLSAPAGVTIEQGAIYIADSDNHRIRKVDASGVISTVVGTGQAGYGGDFGRAAEALINKPSAMVFDRDGTMYIADTANHSIRRVSSGGKITTIAGTGSANAPIDGVAAVGVSIYAPKGLSFHSADTLVFNSTNTDFPGAPVTLQGVQIIPPIVEAVAVSPVGAQYDIVVQGRRFGATVEEGRSRVYLNGVQMTPTYWDNHTIVLRSASEPAGVLELTVGGLEANRIVL